MVLVAKPPVEAIRSYPNPPTTRDIKDIKVYDIAKIDDYFKPITTKNSTVYAGRDSIEGAQIGNLEYLKEKKKQIPQELRGLKNEHKQRRN